MLLLYTRLFLGTLFVLGMALPVVAEDEAYKSLQENSPFLPPDYKPRSPGRPGPAPKPPRPLELTGMLQLDGQWSFSFFDPEKKQSLWVKMNDPAAVVRVVDFNPQAKSVTVENSNGREVIQLKQPGAPTGKAFSAPANPARKTSSAKDKKSTDTDDAAALKFLEELLLLDAALGGDSSPKRDNRK